MRTTTTDCTKADVAVRMERVRKTDEVGDQEVVALDCADLTVGSDEIVALIGPSGSGKTTLCSIAGGILAPTDGAVVVGGEDISGYSSKQLTEFRRRSVRSEEHTSELQSLMRISYAVFCLTKKKTYKHEPNR